MRVTPWACFFLLTCQHRFFLGLFYWYSLYVNYRVQCIQHYIFNLLFITLQYTSVRCFYFPQFQAKTKKSPFFPRQIVLVERGFQRGGGVTNWILKHVPPFGAGFVLPNAPCQMVRLESTVRATVPGGVRRSQIRCFQNHLYTQHKDSLSKLIRKQNCRVEQAQAKEEDSNKIPAKTK